MNSNRANRSDETQLSNAIRCALTAKGCRCIRIQSGVIQIAGKTKRFVHCAAPGTPDLLVVRPAVPVAMMTFIEVKSKTGKQTAAQLEWDTWAKVNGVRSVVVRSIGEAVAAVFGKEAAA